LPRKAKLKGLSGLFPFQKLVALCLLLERKNPENAFIAKMLAFYQAKL